MTESLNDMLSAYLDGELSASEVADIEAQLESDPALRQELNGLREVVGALRADPVVAAPAGFHARVLDAVAEEPVPDNVENLWDWIRRPFGIPAEGLALAAVALMVLFVSVTPSDPPSVAAGMANGTEERLGDRELVVEGPVPFVGTLPEALAFTTSNEDALQSIVELTNELGIRLLDEEGHRVTDLSLHNHRTVWVEVPVERYDALKTGLREHGTLREGPLGVVGGTPLLRIEVQLDPPRIRP